MESGPTIQKNKSVDRVLERQMVSHIFYQRIPYQIFIAADISFNRSPNHPPFLRFCEGDGDTRSAALGFPVAQMKDWWEQSKSSINSLNDMIRVTGSDFIPTPRIFIYLFFNLEDVLSQHFS